MGAPIVLSLCDRTGNMVAPWLDAGHECWIVDLQHEPGEHRDGRLVRVGADLRTWLPPRREYLIAFAFPPCTNLSVSGARWFKEKGLAGLSEGIALVERAALICQWAECPWMLENPISVLSSHWRKPDAIVHPWQFAGANAAENYTKATCLWTGGGFRLPELLPAEPPHRTDIWSMGPSPDRGDKRSATPTGFATAVYQANAKRAECAA
jgi:hypothetical protein